MPNHLATAVAVQRGGDLVRASVLPNDRVTVRLASNRIPYHCCFTLVGDAEARKISSGQIAPCQRLLNDFFGALPDLLRIMLNPPRSGQDLAVLQLVFGNLAPGVIEDHATCARRTLVDCCYEVGHGVNTILEGRPLNMTG